MTYTATGLSRGTTYFFQVIPTNTVGYTKTFAAPAVGWPHPSVNGHRRLRYQVAIP